MVINPLSKLYNQLIKGYELKLESVLVLKSKTVLAVLDILLLEGFIRGYTFNTKDSGKIKVLLKYSLNGREKAIRDIKGVSKPSKRFYVTLDDLWSFYWDLPFVCLVLSTSKGIMTSKEALKYNIGGELLCYVI